MSRSRTATLRPPPIWNARSQTVAGSSTAISSASGHTSIGGPSQPPRANQPEMVSYHTLAHLRPCGRATVKHHHLCIILFRSTLPLRWFPAREGACWCRWQDFDLCFERDQLAKLPHPVAAILILGLEGGGG